MAEQLALDAVLISPLTDGFRFHGRHDVAQVFASAFDLLNDITIHRVTGSERDWVVYGTNSLNGHNLEEVQWLRLNDEGLIAEVTLFIRPVAAAVTLLTRIGGRLHARGVMPRRSAVAAASLAPFGLLFRMIERHLMKRLGPHA